VLPNPFDDKPTRIKTKVATTYVLLVVANTAAWIWALFAFADRPALLGTTVLAYMFGLRHAFDGRGSNGNRS
jgi:high-affinity nickel-transport protein